MRHVHIVRLFVLVACHLLLLFPPITEEYPQFTRTATTILCLGVAAFRNCRSYLTHHGQWNYTRHSNSTDLLFCAEMACPESNPPPWIAMTCLVKLVTQRLHEKNCNSGLHSLSGKNSLNSCFWTQCFTCLLYLFFSL